MAEKKLQWPKFVGLVLPDMEEQKLQWPELVGLTGEEAKEKVLKDRPDVRVEILDENSPTTRDLRDDRVRIFVNKENKVVRAPYTG